MFNGILQWTADDQLNFVIHVDGDVPIDISVRAYNNEDFFSQAVNGSLTSAPLSMFKSNLYSQLV